VAGEVVGPEVGLGLEDQMPADPPIGGFDRQPTAEQLPGHPVGWPVEKVAGERAVGHRYQYGVVVDAGW
jgi:hypothetical protein